MAVFQSLAEKLGNAFKKFRSKGKLTEADVKAGMREVKLALLEADVNYKVVKDFVKIVTERAVGAQVLESLMAEQQIIKIVNEELTSLMGGTVEKLTLQFPFQQLHLTAQSRLRKGKFFSGGSEMEHLCKCDKVL